MNKQQIINLAKIIAAEENWNWIEPVDVKLHRRWFGVKKEWVLRTNSSAIGSNIQITFDMTGNVMKKGFLAR